ncbi:MAG: hypothetical protein M9924_17330 [Rhizobiaceae bacterium]|nr:hypothetical protein [Rhizobiaceae bacterium]
MKLLLKSLTAGKSSGPAGSISEFRSTFASLAQAALALLDLQPVGNRALPGSYGNSDAPATGSGAADPLDKARKKLHLA